MAIPPSSVVEASATVTGGVRIHPQEDSQGNTNGIGSGININGNGVIYMQPATGSLIGGVVVGSGLSITAGGVLSATYSYSLPTAAAGTLGGVKIGSGISIASGVITPSWGGTGSATTVARSDHTHDLSGYYSKGQVQTIFSNLVADLKTAGVFAGAYAASDLWNGV
jgi:hypothetical protein